MIIEGKFTSVWDGGVVNTPANLNTETGEVSTTSIDVDSLGTLMEEWFETEDDIYDVCPECHEFILKTVMKDGIGHTYNEVKVCSDPDCENN